MITAATCADIEQLCELLGILFEQESDFAPDVSKQRTGLRLVIENPEQGRIFVMRSDSLIVGMLNLLTVVSSRKGGVAVVLEDLIVRSEFRGAGIGTALLKYALAFAQELGAVQVTLLTEATNQRAIRLYQRAGFACSGETLKRLTLAPPGQ